MIHSNRLQFNCLYCGEEFRVTKSEAKKRTPKYCSRECTHLARRRQVKKNCENCGREYEVKVSKSEQSRYCSRNCVAVAKKWKPRPPRPYPSCLHCGKECNYPHAIYCSQQCLYEWERALNTKNCAHCGSPFHRKPYLKAKFCSRECYFASIAKEMVTFDCDNCGQTTTRSLNKFTNSKRFHFCKKQCMVEFLRGPNAFLWRDGKSKDPYPTKFKGENKFKDSIRARDDYTCQVCGITQEELGRRLSLHHIDYNKQNLDLLNLISVCIRCNGKANHDEMYWQMFFRNLMVQRGLAPEEYANWP